MMLFRKTEHRRMHPYVVLAVGTLAMIGAVTVVKESKKTAKCMKDKMTSMFVGEKSDECAVYE